MPPTCLQLQNSGNIYTRSANPTTCALKPVSPIFEAARMALPSVVPVLRPAMLASMC